MHINEADNYQLCSNQVPPRQSMRAAPLRRLKTIRRIHEGGPYVCSDSPLPF